MSSLGGDEIVITGISGKFPNARNVHHFRDNLFDKIDMVCDDHRRWEPLFSEVPQRTGKLYDIEKFDLGFFGFTQLQCDNMDPVVRMTLETAVEAIIDAGHHPSDLTGTNTAVCAGCCYSETEKDTYYDNLKPSTDAPTGVARSMNAKQVSYFLQLKGPSVALDTACSSSLYALETAYALMRRSKCDRVLVCGSNIVLQPLASLQFFRLGVLSRDGSCKSFDESGNGYARAEGVVAILLERADSAKRVYAEIVHAKTNSDGHKKEGITYPSAEGQSTLMKEIYDECKVDPTSLTFLEAHGTGTVVGDPEELSTIDAVFCTGRDRPLLIGSTKSCIGHNEPASGLSSVVKVIIGMEAGFIPPNINYKNPRKGVEGLEKGRMVVVTEKTPLPDDRGLFGVNSFGFGGSNAHVLLHWNPKAKINGGKPNDDLPRMICISSRTKEGLEVILDDFSARGCDAEYAYIIHQAFRKPTEGHLYRGYGIYTKQREISKKLGVYIPNDKKLCFILGNHDKRNINFYRGLMNFDVFRSSIQRIQEAIGKVIDVNLKNILLSNTKQSKFNILLTSTAGQIGLATMLKAIKLIPHKIIGVGSGELVAAYLDDYLTLKQTILCLLCIAYNLENNEHKFNTLEEILVSIKASCEKWIPTRERELKGNTLAKYFVDSVGISSHAKNIYKLLPKDVVPLIVAGDFETNSRQFLNLVNGGSNDVIEDFLGNLGSLYLQGFDMELDKLYPSVALPVSRGTPMLSPLIKWDHSRDCRVHFYKHLANVNIKHTTVYISTKSEDWNFIVGHVIDGRNLFPATGYLFLVWECMCNIKSKELADTRIVFEDVKFIRATHVPNAALLDLRISLHTFSHAFEIVEGGVTIVTGRAYEATDAQIMAEIPTAVCEEHELCLNEKDIYKELKLRGYHYSGQFRNIKKCNVDGTQAVLKWENNWIPFLDCLLQLSILQKDTRNTYLPTSIQQLVIDGPKHMETVQKYNNMVPVWLSRELRIVRSAGIELKSLLPTAIARRKTADPVLEYSKFIPDVGVFTPQDSARIFGQMILENARVTKVKMVEVCPEGQEVDQLLCLPVQRALEDLPLIQSDITVLTKKQIDLPQIKVVQSGLDEESNCLILVVSNILETIEASVALKVVGDAYGFIITRENLTFDLAKFASSPFTVLCVHTNDKEHLVLLRPTPQNSSKTYYLDLTNGFEDVSWITRLQDNLKSYPKVVLYAQNEDTNGILGFLNCLRCEPYCQKVSCVFIMEEAPKFNPELQFYKEILNRNMAVSVWKDGRWGTYRHFTLPDLPIVQKEHCYAGVTTRGDLSSIKWLEGSLGSQDSPQYGDKELVHIYYSALNFRDLMTASGKIQLDTDDRIGQEFTEGFEFSGRNSKGDRVMGVNTSGALATLTLCDRASLAQIPENWSMEDAATVTVVYSTVIQALLSNSTPQAGQTILIHSGMGGVGQAAINLSLYYGLTVFVTVGTQEKRDSIRKYYPQIREEHIGNSRDTSFETMIFRYTNGRGVDYVLNSLAEEKLLASVRCLANGGRFMEIGKFDLGNNNPLAMHLLEKNAQFAGIAIDKFMGSANKTSQDINTKLAYLIKCGAVKPIPRTVFEPDQVEQAFRHMGTGVHMGKVLIKIRDEEGEKVDRVPRTFFEGAARFYSKPESSYIICGGLGGFGLELADFLVMRGARKLVLTSKSGVCNGYQRYRMRIWQSYGVKVSATTLDASTEDGCIELLSLANNLGPVDGIFNLAAVLRDAIFENQTIEDFKTSLMPKANSTKNLDSISRRLCPNLRYFVVFSSISCGRGNAGQTNYGMANSIMERICEKRKKAGYPALAIQWGAIGEVGLVAQMQEDHKELVIGGTLQQRISNCIEMMDKLLMQDEPIVASMVVAEKKFGGKASNMFDAVLNILGVKNLKSVSIHTAFPELGMDSMMAVEIKQTLEREYEVLLSPQDIRGMTLAKLKQISNAKESSEAVTAPTITADTILAQAKLLFPIVGDEELIRTPVVRMRTLIENDDEDAPHIFILPGIEGIAQNFATLCKKLKAHVSCAQYSMENTSINQMAANILPHVPNRKGRLTIMGYSMGTLVATELLHMLEAKGKKVNVVFVDGSSEWMLQLARIYFPKDDRNMYETAVLMYLMSNLVPPDFLAKHLENVSKCPTYTEKIDYMINACPDIGIPRNFILEMCTAVRDRIRAGGNYTTKTDKVKSPVTLYKASVPSVMMSSNDYGLSSLFENVADVITFDGDHRTILENDKLAMEINRIIAGN